MRMLSKPNYKLYKAHQGEGMIKFLNMVLFLYTYCKVVVIYLRM